MKEMTNRPVEFGACFSSLLAWKRRLQTIKTRTTEIPVQWIKMAVVKGPVLWRALRRFFNQRYEINYFLYLLARSFCFLEVILAGQ